MTVPLVLDERAERHPHFISHRYVIAPTISNHNIEFWFGKTSPHHLQTLK